MKKNDTITIVSLILLIIFIIFISCCYLHKPPTAPPITSCQQKCINEYNMCQNENIGNILENCDLDSCVKKC